MQLQASTFFITSKQACLIKSDAAFVRMIEIICMHHLLDWKMERALLTQELKCMLGETSCEDSLVVGLGTCMHAAAPLVLPNHASGLDWVDTIHAPAANSVQLLK